MTSTELADAPALSPAAGPAEPRRLPLAGLGAVWLAATAGAIALALRDPGPVPHSLELWNNAARTSLPGWLVAWLAGMVATFLASVFFVRRHVPARWVLGGFLASHALVAVLELGGLATMRTGLVSVTHVLGWTPAGIAVLRAIPGSDPGSAFGRWCRLLALVIAIAFVFDVRDAALYLYYLGTGHPALAAPPG